MKRKIGFSDIGGIYIGKDIQTASHVHYAITIAVSFSGNIDFECESESVSFSSAVIQSATKRRFTKPDKEFVAFIHIEPFSLEGRKLICRDKNYAIITQQEADKILKSLKIWFESENNDEETTKKLIQNIVDELAVKNTEDILFDERIEKTILLIRNSEYPALEAIAKSVHLSAYRLSHLFKQQTGVSFREYVLYVKLVKSLKAIVEKQSLTISSYTGGFSDQSHFIRTYYKAFGILPSQSVK